MNESDPNAPSQMEALNAKNYAVTNAYYNIVNDIKDLVKQQPANHAVIIETGSDGTWICHELYSLFIIISLKDNFNERFITYATNLDAPFSKTLTNSAITRLIYNHTAKANTEVNIEACLEEDEYIIWEYTETKQLAESNTPGFIINDY